VYQAGPVGIIDSLFRNLERKIAEQVFPIGNDLVEFLAIVGGLNQGDIILIKVGNPNKKPPKILAKITFKLFIKILLTYSND